MEQEVATTGNSDRNIHQLFFGEHKKVEVRYPENDEEMLRTKALGAVDSTARKIAYKAYRIVTGRNPE